MGKSHSKLELKRCLRPCLHACDQLYKNTRNFLDDPNNFTKTMFLASIKIAKTEIDKFVQAYENSTNVNKDVIAAMKFVSTIFDKDFGMIRKFCGHYDNDFFEKAFEALDALNDLNLLLTNHRSLLNIDSFKDKFRRAFINFFLWFTASSLRVDDMPETKINNVLVHLIK